MKLNIPNLFNFLLLVSFVCGVTVDSGYNMKQRKIATKTKLRNNWDETPETAITSLITMPQENKINREFNNVTNYNYKIGRNLRKRVKGIVRPNNFYRGIRNIIDKLQESDSLECLSCFGNGVTKKDDDCYRGIALVYFVQSALIYFYEIKMKLQKNLNNYVKNITLIDCFTL